MGLYLRPFRSPHYQEKISDQHTDSKCCFESASCKSCLFNVHNEAVFLVISFGCTQEKGLDLQHMVAGVCVWGGGGCSQAAGACTWKADLQGSTLAFSPSSSWVQPSKSANEAGQNAFLQLNPQGLLIECLPVPLSSSCHDAPVIIPRNPCTWPSIHS